MIGIGYECLTGSAGQSKLQSPSVPFQHKLEYRLTYSIVISEVSYLHNGILTPIFLISAQIANSLRLKSPAAFGPARNGSRAEQYSRATRWNPSTSHGHAGDRLQSRRDTRPGPRSHRST